VRQQRKNPPVSNGKGTAFKINFGSDRFLHIPYPILLRRMIRKRKRRKLGDLVVVDITGRSQSFRVKMNEDLTLLHRGWKFRGKQNNWNRSFQCESGTGTKKAVSLQHRNRFLARAFSIP
jgi:hypothetical protein